MNTIIIPVVIIIVCIGALGAIFIIQKKSKIKEREVDKGKDFKTAQEFVNVLDIRKNFLYTRDNKIATYIKVQPVAIELMNKNEQRILANKLTAELSSEDAAFKFIAVSQPVDIRPLIEEYSNMLIETDNIIRKDIIRNEIKVLNDFMISGEVVERQFYYMLWHEVNDYAEDDLKKRSTEFLNKLNNVGIRSELLDQKEIIRLCNLINNPAYLQEEIDLDATIPDIGE